MNKVVIGALIVVILFAGIIYINNNKSTSRQETGSITITQKPMAEVKNLKIEDTQVGEGQEVKSGDTVVMHYKGTFTNGSVFDSSYQRGQPFETLIGAGKVIQGWDEGVPGMKVGGKRKLTIPPEKAYGSQGIPGAIPPNSTLIFEVELLEIK